MCTIDKPDPSDEENFRKWAIDQRTPGKLKVEFGFRSGYFVALSPKAYMSYNSKSEKCKKGNKGIPQSEKVQLDTFLKILLDNHHHEVELRTLQMDVHNRMTRQGRVKAG